MPPHCDTMDGPVVTAAQKALETENVKHILPWVPVESEHEVEQAFLKTLKVREYGTEARELAEYWFFETCVRVHRVMEGAPYTGLKPAGLEVGPAVRAADDSLKKGSTESLIKFLQETIATGIKDNFEQAMVKRAKADESVEAGRAWVQSYIAFVHYVKSIYNTAEGMPSHENR